MSSATNTIIAPGQDIDIIADVTNDDEPVTLKCQGPAMSEDTVNLLSVFGGNLRLTGLVLRQESTHPERHALYVDKG